MRIQSKIQTLAAFGACALMFTSFSTAQVTTTPPANRNQQTQDGVAGGADQAGALDSHTTGSMIRASQLMGVNIQNDAGESVGEVKDIVLDTRTGKIGYVAVTYGGFLGIGNDLHAVPMQAFRFKQDPDDADDTLLVLNVTQKQMEGAKGFTEESWPNFADETFRAGLDSRYGIDRSKLNR